MKSFGFKEWAVVCEALGRGQQCVIVRKGGIAEGRQGFAFRHPEFFLFPTFFHEQSEKTRLRDAPIPAPNEREVALRFFAKVESTSFVTRWETAEALSPLHVLQPAVVRERFDYDDAKGLHVALVRVFRVEPEWTLPNEKSYGGCRSWVQLPEWPAATQFQPVLSDAEHRRRADLFRQAIGAERALS